MEILIGISWNVRHAVSRRLSKISVHVCACMCIRICIVSEHILNVKYADVRGRRRSAYLRKYIMYLHTVSKSGYAFIFKGILISKLRINPSRN